MARSDRWVFGHFDFVIVIVMIMVVHVAVVVIVIVDALGAGSRCGRCSRSAVTLIAGIALAGLVAGAVRSGCSGCRSCCGRGQLVRPSGGSGQSHGFTFQRLFAKRVQLERFAVFSSDVHQQAIVGDAEDSRRLRRRHLAVPDVVQRFRQITVGPGARGAAAGSAVLAFTAISC